MHLVQSFVLSCLAATSLALPSNEGTKHQQNKARSSAGYSLKEPPLTTPWTDKVGTNPWPEYPRPLLQRSEWKNLNGVWKYQSAASLDALQQPPFGQELEQDVLIPSCLESGLSGRSCAACCVIIKSLTNICRNTNRFGLVLLVFNILRSIFFLEG